MPSPSSIFLVWTASFIATVAIAVFVIRRTPARFKIFAFILASLASIVWLGLVKGGVAVLIIIAITTGYVATRFDARRIGKRVSRLIDVPPNLFFSSLEQVLPFHLQILAKLERDGQGTLHATKVLLPSFSEGLDALEGRFGIQPQIEKARENVKRYVHDHDQPSET